MERIPSSKLAFAALLVAALGTSPTSADTSILQIGGAGASFSLTTTDFLPAGGGTGTIAVGATSSGTYALSAGGSGQIGDLNYLAQPPNTSISASFVTLAAQPSISTLATLISLGVGGSVQCFAAPAVGQVCSPPVSALASPSNLLGTSPYTFTNTNGGSTLTFSLLGTAANGTADPSALNAQFTTQFVGRSYQSVLETLFTQGPVAASYSGTVTATGGSAPGTIQIGAPELAISSTGIDFLPSGGSGSFDVGGTSSGFFTPWIGSAGTMSDLDYASQPVGSPFSLHHFLTLLTLPSLDFELTGIEAGVFGAVQCGSAPAAGQTCTLPGSALNFLNTATGSTLSFVLEGVAHNTAVPGQDSPFTALFTAQFGQSYQFVLAAMSEGGSVTASYSASIALDTPTVPEPASLALMAVALVALATSRPVRRSIARKTTAA